MMVVHQVRWRCVTSIYGNAEFRKTNDPASTLRLPGNSTVSIQDLAKPAAHRSGEGFALIASAMWRMTMIIRSRDDQVCELARLSHLLSSGPSERTDNPPYARPGRTTQKVQE
jgi:hypothetical protein